MLRSIPHARMRNPAQFLPHPFHARRDEMASPSGDSCGTLSDSEEMGYEEDIEGKLESSCDSRQVACVPGLNQSMPFPTAGLFAWTG